MVLMEMLHITIADGDVMLENATNYANDLIQSSLDAQNEKVKKNIAESEYGTFFLYTPHLP